MYNDFQKILLDFVGSFACVRYEEFAPHLVLPHYSPKLNN